MFVQTERVGRVDAVALFRAEILRMQASEPGRLTPGGADHDSAGVSDRVEISRAARLLAQMAAGGVAGEPSDERLAAFLQAYGGIYGVDFGCGLPAGEAYDRTGRRVRPEILEALRRELRRYAAGSGGDGHKKDAAPRPSAGLHRLFERIRRRLRHLFG